MFEVIQIGTREIQRMLRSQEGHFVDFKAIDVSPGKLSKSLSAFANADGGDLYVGIAEKKSAGGAKTLHWGGFKNEEAANAHIQVIMNCFPLMNYVKAQFWKGPDRFPGLVLYISVEKTPDVRPATDSKFYIRRGAQSLPVTTDKEIHELRLAKGEISHEDMKTELPTKDLAESPILNVFLENYVPSAEPEDFLNKQKIARDGVACVSGCLLFSEEPQVELSKASIKIYRYNTSEPEGRREHLSFDPISIEGSAISQIQDSVAKTAELAEAIEVLRAGKLEKVEYPREAIHEIVTNAVLHRDYSIQDNIHIRIFDNRIEVQSPGRLPGYVTAKNIRDVRFSRNGKLVRLINKFPDPPNKDVGEGMNTAFEFMEKLKLKPPFVEEINNSVLVVLKHEPLARPERLILDYLQENDVINNRMAREITGIGSENKVKNIFNKLMEDGLILKNGGKQGNKTSYSITAKGKTAHLPDPEP